MRIANIQIVASFELDQEITFTVGDGLKKLKDSLKGQLHLINVPEAAPPSTPRALFKAEDTILAVGYDRFDFNTKPPKHINDSYESSMTFAHDKVVHLFHELINGAVKYRWTGIVTQLEFPLGDSNQSALEVIAPIIEALIKPNVQDKDLAAFNLQLGFMQNGFNKIYSIKGYENRKLDIIIKGDAQVVNLSDEDYEIIESGVQITLDINNKPNPSGDPFGDMAAVIDEHFESSVKLLDELNLSEVLK